MAELSVRKLTLAYLRGEVTAETVVSRIKAVRPKGKTSADETLLETSEGFVKETSEDTWATVDRYWGLMTKKQQNELLAARKRLLGT